MTSQRAEQIDTVVIGGGQAGLSVGYHLTRRNVPFVILDAADRVGDAWRNRWDTLRLFTPARYDGLDGMPFPAEPHYFPTKDEMADYLESYAEHFRLPVHSGVRVDGVTPHGNGRFRVDAGDHRYEASNVVVAMSSWQRPKLPEMADSLSPVIHQLHSSEYRNPSQLEDGDVLVVGAGNSGADIALDVVGDHRTLLAGRPPGHVPFRIEGVLGRLLVPVVLRFLFHRVLTIRTPIGRRARPKILASGDRLVRTKPKDLVAAGVEAVPRVVEVRDGYPVLDDGRTVEPANVIWCTGFHPGFSWIDHPGVENGRPEHHGGVVDTAPGLFFVGLKYLYSFSSAEVHGVGRDAERIAGLVADRRRSPEVERAES